MMARATASRGARWCAFGTPSDCKPHRAFKLSTEPLFIEKLRDIVGLHLTPPDRALVCRDEKSQIQALDPTQPGKLPSFKKGSRTTRTRQTLSGNSAGPENQRIAESADEAMMEGPGSGECSRTPAVSKLRDALQYGAMRRCGW